MNESNGLAKNFRDIAIILTVVNFVWQMLPGQHHWGTAFERSFSQALALGIAWLVIRARNASA